MARPARASKPSRIWPASSAISELGPASTRRWSDFRGTTIGHIGELTIPIANGVITEADVLADLYDLAHGATGRRSKDEITIYKNGGGGHLDLMTARAIFDATTAKGTA